MPHTAFLLIAFKFPPHAEVGSRRWTKLARHLADHGHRIHVITVNWNTDGPNALDEVTHPGITIHRLPALGPRKHHRAHMNTPAAKNSDSPLLVKLIRQPKPYFFAGLMRIRQLLIRILTSLGLMEDTRFWGYAMVPFARRLVRREGIPCVIATGPPFMANWWAGRLKSSLPGVKLIQDMRDPWASLPASVYSATSRNPDRSRILEAEALDAADAVVTVTDGYKGLLVRNTKTPITVIPNGYDASEFPENRMPREREFRLVYAGSVAGGRKDAARALLEAVREMGTPMRDISVEFWGPPLPPDISLDYADLMALGVLKVCGRVSGPEIMRIISEESFACIQLTAREMPEALSTKVYDYARARRPILCINYGGEIDTFIRKHQLGWSVNGDDASGIRSALDELHELWRSDPAAESHGVGIEEYDYRNIAERYSQLIDRLVSSEAASPR